MVDVTGPAAHPRPPGLHEVLRRLFGVLPAGTSMGVAVTVLGLFGWAMLPYVLGWQPSVVVTGSMAPAIRTGDIVVTADVEPDALRAGQVIRFVDPARPERDLMHRIVRVNRDHSLITRGDANRTADLTPVPPANVVGVARLRIPVIGLPSVWLRDGATAPLALTAVGVVAVAYLLSGLCAGRAGRLLAPPHGSPPR